MDIKNAHQHRWLEAFATTVSVLFHPMLMVTYLCVVMHYVFSVFSILSEHHHLIIFGIAFVFTFVLPSAFILMLYKFKILSDLGISERSERSVPYYFTAFFYFFSAYLFDQKQFIDPKLIQFTIFGGVAILIASLFNRFFKISAHTLALFAGVGMFGYLCFQNNNWLHFATFMVSILLGGLVVSSRLWLRAHDLFEVSTGAVVGLAWGIMASFILF